MIPRESPWTKLWAGTSSEELCLLYREAQVLPIGRTWPPCLMLVPLSAEE